MLKCLCAGGLLIVDVSDPENPTYAGCFGADGYVHDAECVVYNGPDLRYDGHEVTTTRLMIPNVVVLPVVFQVTDLNQIIYCHNSHILCNLDYSFMKR